VVWWFVVCGFGLLVCGFVGLWFVDRRYVEVFDVWDNTLQTTHYDL